MDDQEARRSFQEHLAELKRKQRERIAAIGAVVDGAIVKDKDRDHWLLLSPAPEGKGQWRVTSFDRDGFSGHELLRDKASAIEEAARRGYTQRDDAVLDELFQTPRFQRGIQVADIIGRSNAREISMDEANAAIDALGREAA